MDGGVSKVVILEGKVTWIVVVAQMGGLSKGLAISFLLLTKPFGGWELPMYECRHAFIQYRTGALGGKERKGQCLCENGFYLLKSCTAHCKWGVACIQAVFAEAGSGAYKRWTLFCSLNV